HQGIFDTLGSRLVDGVANSGHHLWIQPDVPVNQSFGRVRAELQRVRAVRQVRNRRLLQRSLKELVKLPRLRLILAADPGPRLDALAGNGRDIWIKQIIDTAHFSSPPFSLYTFIPFGKPFSSALRPFPG